MNPTTTTVSATPPAWFVFVVAFLTFAFFFGIVYGPKIQDKFQAVRRHVEEIRRPSNQSEQDDQGPTRFRCRERCGAGPFPKRHDKELHEEAKHGIDRGFGVKSNSEEKTTNGSSSNTNRVRLRDFVDKSTTPDWLQELQEEDDEGIALQEPEGGKDRELEASRLRKCWEPVLSRLKQQGVVEIGKNEHPLGRKGPRGPDAARLFEQQAKRMDLDFDVEVELGKPSIIKTS